MRFARSEDGTALAWASVGEGPPLLQGGHWLSSHLEYDWQSPLTGPFIDRMAAVHRLIRYDPRGTGLSDREPRNIELPSFVDDMQAVADASGLDRFAIFATSQSVPVAIGLAARCPDRVSRMVLHNGFVQGSTARGELDKTEAMVSMIQNGWGVAGSVFVKAFSTVFLPESTPDEIESFIELQAVATSPEVAADLRRAIGRMDVSDLLERVQAPALILHASRNAVVPIEEARRMAMEMPNAELRQYDSANQISVPSDPHYDQICEDILAFLAEDSRTPA